MNKLFCILHSICFIFISFNSLVAQLENIVVEKYYISDSIDATDTTGGGLEAGTTTYRIFVDLKPGSKLRKIYGTSNHPLKFISSAPFFNNKVDGQSFGNEFSKIRYSNNTVALDTWITLGQTTKIATVTNFGILKSQDRNGSFIGGSKNDGGSANIPNGLLRNNNPLIGIPITISDGMDTMNKVPTNWVNYGFKDLLTGLDTSIFGSIIPVKEFISTNAGLQNSGVTGVISDSNQILIAQLTTKGDLSFALNLEVEEELKNGTKQIIKYVSSDDILEKDEIYNPILKYPATCGCKDPNYLEAQRKYSCENKDSCKTLIVFGCTDSLACNYKSTANFNVPEICCYVGYCRDQDLSQICSELAIRIKNSLNKIELIPNPIHDYLFIKQEMGLLANLNYKIYNSLGVEIEQLPIRANSQIDLSKLENGIYFLRITMDKISVVKVIVKS